MTTAISYVVRAGDTPRRIAASFGISYRSLAAANPQWIEDEPLIEGELLQVPVRLPRRCAVLGGDTWETIAARSGFPAARLREINGCAADEQPEEGQVIELPAAGGDRIVKTGAEYGSDPLAKDIERLKREYPFLTVTVIGHSVMGKPIHALRIGEGSFRLHANGAVHANEWITSLALMRFVEEYARACKWHGSIGGRTAAALYRCCTLWIVPMANPDGADLSQSGLRPDHPFYKDLLRWNNGSRRFDRWKANVRGVDLNDQFPAFWEEERKRRGRAGPGPRDYSGPAPLSEPEARALAELAREIDCHAALSFHTQGEEIYWNYRGLEPEVSESWAGRLAHASGYRAVKLEGSDAGFKDWFIAEFRRPGFTLEMGWGRNPLPLRVFPDVYEDMLAMLLEAMELRKESNGRS